MTNRDRIVSEFQTLVSIDAESCHEEAMASYLTERLRALGLSVTRDEAGNLFAVLPGTREGAPLLFSSHMDTVSPGLGKRAVLHPDGTVTSDGTTVLGADDSAGLAAILEALTVIQERNLSHPEIEVLFSAAEELYSRGCARFDFSRVRARSAYVLDLTGPVGTAALAAPSILSLDIRVTGRAAHAGFAPEEGVNALSIAARALAALETGRVEPDTTVNFGTVEGGSGKNIVPASVSIRGEIRSLRHEKALERAEAVRARFASEAEAIGGEALVTVTEELRAYRIPEDAPVVRRFRAALASLGWGEGMLTTTFGGSDNNHFPLHGIEGVVLACAMENVHTTAEYTRVSELQRSAELTLRLMTMEDEA